jgi:hypothetical protein
MKFTPKLRHKTIIIISASILLFLVYELVFDTQRLDLKESLVLIGLLLLSILVSFGKLKDEYRQKNKKTA